MTPSGWVIIRNLSSVLLAKNKKYLIKNLSIDIGQSYVNGADFYDYYTSTPIRFILSNDPLSDEYNRLKDVFPSYVIRYNNVIKTNNVFDENPISNDIIDNSNVDHGSGIYYNCFQISSPSYINLTPIRLSSCKSETVSIYEFMSLSSFEQINTSQPRYRNLAVTNNDISDFYFDSKSYSYLNFSVYPYIYGTGSAPLFTMLFTFTVNFDLEES